MKSKLDELLDDGTEICIDNVLWDYAGFIHSPAPELSGRERKYDIARNALRSRIRELIEEAKHDHANKLIDWIGSDG